MLAEPAKVSALSLSLAQSQLSTLIGASNAFDTKASGVLAFDGALFAGLIAVQDKFMYWWAPSICLIVSAAASAWALTGRTYELGPDAGDFYTANAQADETGGNLALLAEIRQAVGLNGEAVRHKGSWLLGAVVLLLIGLVVAGFTLRPAVSHG